MGLTVIIAMMAAALLALARKLPAISGNTQAPTPLNSLSIE
jgi:hypothetical protein